jgi:hypothetical protein
VSFIPSYCIGCVTNMAMTASGYCSSCAAKQLDQVRGVSPWVDPRTTEAPADPTTTEKVNHPHHYNCHPSGIECIEVVRHMGFNLGNAVKYIWRADLKGDSLQDLEKAVWYLQDEIAKRKRLAANG